jgi:hypothetical protein
MRYTHPVLCVLFAVAAPAAFAGSHSFLKSSSGGVQLVAVVHEQLSIVPSSAAVNASMQPQGLNSGAEHPVTFTTSWNLDGQGTGFAVQAFYTGLEGALGSRGGSTGTLDSFPLLARAPAGASSGGGFLVFGRGRAPGQSELASRTDAVDLPVDRVLPAQAAARTSGGVLTLVAVVY